MMEHRWNRRVRTCLRALLVPAEGPVASGIIRNVSYEGMYVETPAILRRNIYLEVRFAAGIDQYQSLRRLPALIVRVDGSGVGLQLENIDRPSSTLLQHLMTEPTMGIESYQEAFVESGIFARTDRPT